MNLISNYFLSLIGFLFIQGIVANTVGPFNNPTETYPFYSLPFCSGTGRQRRHKLDLGETLSGSRLDNGSFGGVVVEMYPFLKFISAYTER